jgi:membrane protease YdiL (CAAX protease family)
VKHATARVIVGGVALWAIMDRAAALSGSLRGEWGAPIAAVIVAGALAVAYFLHAERPRAAIVALGLGRAPMRGILAAVGIAALLALYFPLLAPSATIRPGWPLEALGLFAQAGIAEETIFRGHVFGRLRATHTFWRATLLSAIPFVGVHLLLFATLDPPIAAAATVLSAAIAPPLARLHELGGTWAPAIVHFAIQGFIKLVDVPESGMPGIAIGWMAACATVPWLAFAVPRARGASA